MKSFSKLTLALLGATALVPRALAKDDKVIVGLATAQSGVMQASEQPSQDSRADRLPRPDAGRLGHARAAGGIHQAAALAGDEARRRQTRLVDCLLVRAADLSVPGFGGAICLGGRGPHAP